MQKLNEFFLGYNRGQAGDRNKKDCVALFAMLEPVGAANNTNTNASSDELWSNDSNDSPGSDLTTNVNTNTNSDQNNFYGALYGSKGQAMEISNNGSANSTGENKAEKGRARGGSVAEQICIATTHIYWNPKFIDVKMKQIKQVLLQLAQFNPSMRNTILCGGTPNQIIS